MGPLDQVLPAHPVLSQHIKLASELDTPEAIFDKVKQQLPAGAQLASGGLLDARGLSDVDISVHDPEALDDYYSIEGYDRPINVKVSPDENVLRAVKHRQLELELEQEFPDLVAAARERKAGGLGTEKAWANLLGLEGDPYEAMLQPDRVREAAKAYIPPTKVASDDWYVGKSEVAGQGVFAGKDYESGDRIGIAMTDGGENEFSAKIWNLTELARYCNHQNRNNVDIEKDGDRFHLVAIKPIGQDEELVSNYWQVARAKGPHSVMLYEGKQVPTSDLSDYVEKEAAEDLQGFMGRSELMGSRGRALKYGRPEPEGRDYDRVVFTDDAEDQQALMKNLREVAKIKGYKQHERPDGFLTISGDNQDLSVYPTSKRDKIYNAWELIEGGMSKDEAWDQIAKEAKDKAVLVTGNPKYIENNPEADAYYQAVEDYLAEQGYSVSRDVGEPYTEPAPADVWLGHSRGVDRLRFAPEGTQTLAFGSGVEGAINHPEDLSLKAEDVPTSAHYQFTDEMKQAITALRAQKQQKEAKDKVEFVHSCCGEPSGKCAGCSEGSVLLPKDEYEKAGDRSSRDKADS